MPQPERMDAPEPTSGSPWLDTIGSYVAPELYRTALRFAQGSYSNPQQAAADLFPSDVTGALPGPMGMAGGVPMAVKRVMLPGRLRVLQSWRGTPQNLMGELYYKPGSLATGEAPFFQSIWSQHPRAAAELRQAFEKDLGPRMNDLQFTPISPGAVPNWEKYIGRGKVDKYPDLKQRLTEEASRVRAANPEGIPQTSYGSGKTLLDEDILDLLR